MNNDLKNLFQQSASDAPAERHGVQDIVTKARRHQRRHSAGVWGGSALALALIVGGGYALLDGPGSDQSQPVTTEERDTTIDLTKARDAVEGKDYELISELEGESVPDSGWSPDDVIPVKVGSDYRFVRSSDGTVVATLEVPKGYLFPWYVGNEVVVWASGKENEGLTPLVQDLSGGDPYEVPITLAATEDLEVEQVRGLAVDSGRLWVSIPVKGADKDLNAPNVVASAPLDGSDGFRREIEGTVFFKL